MSNSTEEFIRELEQILGRNTPPRLAHLSNEELVRRVAELEKKPRLSQRIYEELLQGELIGVDSVRVKIFVIRELLKNHELHNSFTPQQRVAIDLYLKSSCTDVPSGLPGYVVRDGNFATYTVYNPRQPIPPEKCQELREKYGLLNYKQLYDKSDARQLSQTSKEYLQMKKEMRRQAKMGKNQTPAAEPPIEAKKRKRTPQPPKSKSKSLPEWSGLETRAVKREDPDFWDIQAKRYEYLIHKEYERPKNENEKYRMLKELARRSENNVASGTIGRDWYDSIKTYRFTYPNRRKVFKNVKNVDPNNYNQWA